MVEWYWKARYGFYRISGMMRRLLGLSWRGSSTIGEIMSKLEMDRQMRKFLDDAREKTGIKRRHW